MSSGGWVLLITIGAAALPLLLWLSVRGDLGWCAAGLAEPNELVSPVW
jgi:hypothetical protein